MGSTAKLSPCHCATPQTFSVPLGGGGGAAVRQVSRGVLPVPSTTSNRSDVQRPDRPRNAPQRQTSPPGGRGRFEIGPTEGPPETWGPNDTMRPLNQQQPSPFTIECCARGMPKHSSPTAQCRRGAWGVAQRLCSACAQAVGNQIFGG